MDQPHDCGSYIQIFHESLKNQKFAVPAEERVARAGVEKKWFGKSGVGRAKKIDKKELVLLCNKKEKRKKH